jgi:diaminohydroxyphosphoribosylaminopyrimidine deaminase/5-amino-6-(5-phosphoribosylamino)uracil reductase
VILDAVGTIVGRGCTGPAPGSPHAEVAALADAGAAARGGTAVVTLEPCRHVGRTGPCTSALIDAGIVRVVFAQADPTAEAGGGAALLKSTGIAVSGGLLREEAEAVNVAWTFAAVTGRPLVTWKCATSLDGRVAEAGGGPTAITGPAAREQVHGLRAEVDAIVVGTGTALVDDPALTARPTGGPRPTQPLRVVLGSRPLPPGARILDDSAPTLVLDEPDPATVLNLLHARGVRHVLLEGGPVLAGAFLAARLIDRVDWYLAPVLLGDGPVALPVPIAEVTAVGVDVEHVSVVGEDVRVQGWLTYDGERT